MEPLPMTLLARCGCSWQHAVCRVNHPSGMSIVSPHGTFFLLIVTGMRLDVEDTLFLHPLPLPHLCQAKSKVRQLRSQAHKIQADELASRRLVDTCPPPDNSYSCCISYNIHYRSYSPAYLHPHYTCAGSIIATRISFSYICCLYKSNSVLIKKKRKTGNTKHAPFFCFKHHFVLVTPYWIYLRINGPYLNLSFRSHIRYLQVIYVLWERWVENVARMERWIQNFSWKTWREVDYLRWLYYIEL